MKTVHYLLLCIVSRFVDASPARTDCGVTKTFEAVDLCNQTYGGSVIPSNLKALADLTIGPGLSVRLE